LLINDKEVEITECPIKKVINKYKEDIKALDDDTFIEVAERLEDQLDFCKLDELINKDNITKEDSEDIQEALDIIYDEINSVIDERIKNLVKLKERFEVQ
jgi:RNA processing factor Prp31